MLFTSTHYLLFLPVVVLVYYFLPHRFRWVLLLAASFYFYACWSVRMLFWLILVILLSYLAGLLISVEGRCTNQKQSEHRWGIVLGAATLIMILFLCKYLNFLLDQIETLSGIFGTDLHLPRLEWITPVGISFFTFQALGYLFDVYRGKTKPVRHFGKYALFISFFPHLGEGPIDRSDNLLPQIEERHTFDYIAARRSLALIFFGVFKKVVVADRLAVLVDTVFGSVSAYRGLSCWVAALFYSFQIYCDFSGYTDIALGSAGLLGFYLVPNFNTPYLATSIADFWRRWHMSLSRWFRDYLYIPLGGSRVSPRRWALNILVVFLISGIWHGANWTFILWGVMHGLFQIVGKYKSKLVRKLLPNETPIVRIVRILITFFLVTLLWSLFRSASIREYWIFLQGLFSFSPGQDLLSLGMGRNELLLSFAMILLIVVLDLIDAHFGLLDIVERQPLPLRWTLYLLVLFACILFGRYGSLTEDSFIYFQF